MRKQLIQSRALTLFFLLCSGLGLGALSLYFAAVYEQKALLLSYFQDPVVAFFNLAPAVLLVFFLYCLVGRAWISFLASSALVMALTLANWFKLQFRNDPLLFEDILLIKEAGNMTGQYRLFLTKSMAAAFALILLGTAFLFFCARGRAPLWPRMGGVALLLLAVLPLRALYADPDLYADKVWVPTETYIAKGFLYPFLHSATALADQPPPGYSPQRAQALLAAYGDADIPPERQVSLITVMLESYADFTPFEIPGLNPEVYAGYHALEAESYTGNLITNIFSGGTVDSERAYLTGLSDLGSFRTPSNSYPWYFRSQGYTVEGAHPGHQWFYNRANINRNLGYEDYSFVENYFAPMTGDDIGLDNVLFPALIEMWEQNKQPGKPYFAYHLTYQGHGPYNNTELWYGDGYVAPMDYTQETYYILNNYFASLQNTTAHLTEFFDYYRAESEPVVIVLFGDHKPGLGEAKSVYHELGIDMVFSKDPGLYNTFATRYLIWANGAAKEALGRDFVGQGPDISPHFLMNLVFQQCGWTGPAYLQAIGRTMERVSVIHKPTGLYLENGLHTRDLSAEGQALIDDFNILQYYYRKHFLYG